MLRVNWSTGSIVDETSGAQFSAQPLSPYVMEILENGGIKPLIGKERGVHV